MAASDQLVAVRCAAAGLPVAVHPDSCAHTYARSPDCGSIACSGPDCNAFTSGPHFDGRSDIHATGSRSDKYANIRRNSYDRPFSAHSYPVCVR